MLLKNMTKQQLIKELEAHKAELETLKTSHEKTAFVTEGFQTENKQISAIFDGFNEIAYVSDPDTYEVLYVNKYVKSIFGDVVGKKCYKALQRFSEPCNFCTNNRIFDENVGKVHVWEFQNTINNKWYRCMDKAIPWTSGKNVRLEIAIDITDIKNSEEELELRNRTIMELSTPVIQMWEGVIAAPLIGAMDSERTQQFMERLLGKIVETKSPVALVDITGVFAIDTQTAQHIIEAVTAAQLLGTKLVLTGVSPSIAQTLVRLGVDLSGIETRSSLAAGFQVALDYLGVAISSKNGKEK